MAWEGQAASSTAARTAAAGADAADDAGGPPELDAKNLVGKRVKTEKCSLALSHFDQFGCMGGGGSLIIETRGLDRSTMKRGITDCGIDARGLLDEGHWCNISVEGTVAAPVEWRSSAGAPQR